MVGTGTANHKLLVCSADQEQETADHYILLQVSKSTKSTCQNVAVNGAVALK